MKSDREVHRNVWNVCRALARKGLVPVYGQMSSARVVRVDQEERYWVAVITPLPLPGEEWKS